MKKLLAATVSVLVSATPVLAHEIGMEHDHRMLIAIGVIIALSIIGGMLYAFSSVSPKDDDQK